jgi:hypothetical protein
MDLGSADCHNRSDDRLAVLSRNMVNSIQSYWYCRQSSLVLYGNSLCEAWFWTPLHKPSESKSIRDRIPPKELRHEQNPSHLLGSNDRIVRHPYRVVALLIPAAVIRSYICRNLACRPTQSRPIYVILWYDTPASYGGQRAIATLGGFLKCNCLLILNLIRVTPGPPYGKKMK